jgi:GTP cyclohydrolase II
LSIHPPRRFVPHPTQASPRPDRLRIVLRAADDLRRGVPVLLLGSAPLLVLAAEAATAAALEEFAAIAGGPGETVLLAPARAAAMLRRPVPTAFAVRLAGAPTPEALRALADPVAGLALPETLEPAASPALAEAALVLAKLARLLPALLAAHAGAEAEARAAEHGVLAIAEKDVLAGSMPASALVQVAEAKLPMEHAEDSRVVAFRAPDTGVEHLAILIGRPEASPAPLVRIHSRCFTGDLLGSLRCDCGPQLRGAIARMAQEGAGAVLYLAQEGRGIGLVNKLRAYALQDRGLDTLDANRALGWGVDERSFAPAAAMLHTLGIARVRLLTNNPDKLAALAANGIEIAGREPHAFAANGINDHYLATKLARLGHLPP